MKLSTLLPLSLPLLHLTTAWEITWHDASNAAHTRTGHGPSDCIVIDNPKGHLFKIDAQGETNINMLLFTNENCAGQPAGMATQEFSKDSSETLRGFKVVSTATPTATGGTTASATATATSTTGKNGGHNSTMTTTTLSSQTVSSSSGGSGTTTAKTTGATGTAATTTSETSRTGTATTSSAASATTTNAGVQLVPLNGYMAKGLVGGVIGLGMVHWVF